MLHTGVVVLNLEKALTRSENIRRDLVEVNRILMVAVQKAIEALRRGANEHARIDILEAAENEVKKISIVEY